MGLLKEVNGQELDQMIADGTKVFVDFYSNSCGPCKMLAFVLEDVAKTVEGVEVVKINFDTNKETMEKYGVSAYPTMILFENGEEAQRMKGLQQKPAIIKAIQG